MGKGRRRNARRVLLASTALCLVVAAVPSLVGAAPDTVPRPEVFRGNASAQAISLQADRDALLPVPELFKFIALDGAGIYESSNRQARASLLFPGNGLILGPSLACGTFGAQFPPQFKPILDQCLQYQYPLTVFADDFAPDGATSGSLAIGAPGDAISAGAARAVAHAGEDAARTDAVVNDLNVLGAPAFGPVTPQIPGFAMDRSVFTVETATSRTNQRITKGVLEVDSLVTMSGIRLIGGLVNLGSLRSESRVTDDGHGKRTSFAKLEIGGVTAFGMPAQLTDQGLVAGNGAGSGPIADQQEKQVNDALRSLNIRVTVLDSERNTNKNGSAVASVGGILIEFGRDAQGLPTVPGPLGELDLNGFYRGSVQLGATGALGSAASFGLDAIGEDVVGSVDDFSTDLGVGGGSFDAGGVFDDFGASGDLSSSPVAGASPRTPRRPGAPSDTRLVGAVGGTFGDRIGWVYLALMFAVLALCIAPRLTVPARFPGRRP